MSFYDLIEELSKEITFNVPDLRGVVRADRFNPAEPRDKSGKWTGGAGAGAKTEWGTVDWHGVKEIEVAKHPDIDDIDKLGEEDKRSTSERGGGWAPTVRLLKNDKGEVFAWPADKAIHDQVAEGIDFELTPSNSATNTRIVWKKGRKWVSTQSMDGWLREGTIKQIGPNEGAPPTGEPEPDKPKEAAPKRTPEDLNKLHAAATYAAIKQGYPAQKVVIEPEDEWFTVGDKFFKTGGRAYLRDGKYPKGTVAIYGSVSPEHVGPLMAHEIEHQKFQTVLDQKAAEYKEIEAEMDRVRDSGKDQWRDGPLKADGTVRDSYSGRYPTYEALAPILDVSSTLAKDDGVTDYSRAYWDAYLKGKGGITIQSAIHETLAEMAYHHNLVGGEKRFINPSLRGHSSTGGSKIWRDLFAAVNRLYAKKAKA